MSEIESTHRAVVARQTEAGVRPSLERVRDDTLPEGETTIRVEYSSLNYKDVLSAYGNPGITRDYPHVPGIDAAGSVVSDTGGRPRGERVFVTGYDLGMNTDGGLSELVCVPAVWVRSVPDSLDTWEVMAAGTAGFTAAQSVYRVEMHHEVPPQATVLVTGATGAVGSYAVALLTARGYRVIAATSRIGDRDVTTFLRAIGAQEILDARELAQPQRPLLRGRWDAVVDCVGGEPLVAALASVRRRGCATTCGMVAGAEISTSVFPFILRGVALYGIDSAECPEEHRTQIWELLSGRWRLPHSTLERLNTTIGLDEVPDRLDAIRRGRSLGHVVVRVGSR